MQFRLRLKDIYMCLFIKKCPFINLKQFFNKFKK